MRLADIQNVFATFQDSVQLTDIKKEKILMIDEERLSGFQI